MPTLVQKNGCIFDNEQLALSHGFESLDPVGQEAFVNHIHFDGVDRVSLANERISQWKAGMKSQSPGSTFRIYRQDEAGGVTIRFHLVRAGIANWCDDGLEGVEIETVHA